MRGSTERAWARDFVRRFEVEGDCWVWTGRRNSDGHAVIGLEGEMVQAHRIVYEHYVGSIPEGCDVHHDCENKLCVNPDHLQVMGHGDHTGYHNQRR